MIRDGHYEDAQKHFITVYLKNQIVDFQKKKITLFVFSLIHQIWGVRRLTRKKETSIREGIHALSPEVLIDLFNEENKDIETSMIYYPQKRDDYEKMIKSQSFYKSLLNSGYGTPESITNLIESRDKSYDSQLHFKYFEILQNLADLKEKDELNENIQNFKDKTALDIFSFLAEFWNDIGMKGKGDMGTRGFQERLMDRIAKMNKEEELKEKEAKEGKEVTATEEDKKEGEEHHEVEKEEGEKTKEANEGEQHHEEHHEKSEETHVVEEHHEKSEETHVVEEHHEKSEETHVVHAAVLEPHRIKEPLKWKVKKEELNSLPKDPSKRLREVSKRVVKVFGAEAYERFRTKFFGQKMSANKFYPVFEALGGTYKGKGQVYMEKIWNDFVAADGTVPNIKKFAMLERDVLKVAGSMVVEDWSEVQKDLINLIEWGIEVKEPMAIYLGEKMGQIFKLKMTPEIERKIEAFFLYQNNTEIKEKIDISFSLVGKIDRKYSRSDYSQNFLFGPNASYLGTLMRMKHQPNLIDHVEMLGRQYPVSRSKIYNYEPRWKVEALMNKDLFK